MCPLHFHGDGLPRTKPIQSKQSVHFPAGRVIDLPPMNPFNDRAFSSLPCARCRFGALLAAILLTHLALAADGFRIADVNEKSLGLWEGDKPVLVYNHGVIASPPGVPADQARSSYVHPIYGLDGEVLTDDFPEDHYHHRGLFWSWPHVQVGGQHHDLWMLKGIRHQFEKWLDRKADKTAAVLGVENGWYVGTNKVMRERIRLRVYPAAADSRAMDVDCEWTPVGQPITLTGAEGKSYGGIALRFAPGTNTAITISSGLTGKDLPMTNLPWADLTRHWTSGKTTSGAALFVHPSHPDFPPQWLTRHYGLLSVGWPGVKPATFQPDQPTSCRYRVWIHRGSATAAQLEQAYEAFKAPEKAVPARDK